MQALQLISDVPHLVVALMLYMTTKPLVQGVSKLTEFFVHLFGTSKDPRKRNMTVSAELSQGYQDIVGDTTIREPMLPGLALYTFTHLNSSQIIQVGSEPSIGAMISIASAALLFIVFRVMSSLKKSATRSVLPVAHTISAASVVIAGILSVVHGISYEAIAAALICALFAAQMLTLISRGARNYGLFSVFWTPVATFGWLCRVFAIAIAAPLILPLLVIENFLDHPHRKPILGNQTQASS